MRLTKNADGYVLRLSARDTCNWARRPGTYWPCSELADHRLMVVVDENGLNDLFVDGRRDFDCDSRELEAIVADHLPADCQKFWPVWA